MKTKNKVNIYKYYIYITNSVASCAYLKVSYYVSYPTMPLGSRWWRGSVVHAEPTVVCQPLHTDGWVESSNENS